MTPFLAPLFSGPWPTPFLAPAAARLGNAGWKVYTTKTAEAAPTFRSDFSDNGGMKVLYIGGTGEISYSCLEASVAAGHACTVFNRGLSREPLPEGVTRIVGDINDGAAYAELAGQHFDGVCQFKGYSVADIERDIEVFSGHTAQYLFISSASAYQKPPAGHLITENVPLANPYWAYSQAKADMEKRLMQAQGQALPVTIVRPSHTYRMRFPGTFISGDIAAWRMLQGRAVIVHGDGTALWTLTHASDFARPFVQLLGNPRALGEAFHITSDQAYRWDQILAAEAAALGVEPQIVHVPTDTLIRYHPAWVGPLWGDKAWSTRFDNSKIRRIAGEFPCKTALREGLPTAAPAVRQRVQAMAVDMELQSLLDRIVVEQQRLGTK
jgi:nucleoside-diphosphate-sugar epimerase